MERWLQAECKPHEDRGCLHSNEDIRLKNNVDIKQITEKGG